MSNSKKQFLEDPWVLASIESKVDYWFVETNDGDCDYPPAEPKGSK